MAYAYNFRATFTDGTTLDQGEDLSGLVPGRSAFTDLLIMQEQGRRLASFSLFGEDGEASVSLNDGRFSLEGVEIGGRFEAGGQELLPEGVEWVAGHGLPLPEGAEPKLIYYRNVQITSTSDGTPEVTQFCFGWEAAGIKNILGVSPQKGL